MKNEACDVSEVHALFRAADKELNMIPEIMLEAVKNRAAFERRTHVWNNITGLLEKNTRGQMVSRDADPVTVELVMEREYASYVRDRGRTNIDDRAEEAAALMQRKFNAIGDRLGKK